MNSKSCVALIKKLTSESMFYNFIFNWKHISMLSYISKILLKVQYNILMSYFYLFHLKAFKNQLTYNNVNTLLPVTKNIHQFALRLK